MDDSETLCPLCCEELDISDRQFFPCKCGYQVCMWCWHRIRESESGLCPACRTPYGDDPHEFSAVDVADVLKANKEKAAAEKRERERLKLQQGAEGTQCTIAAAGQMDVPRDRSQLGNMRVIRRNLVYAVGLPPSIAIEDTLRKPEYFGQYGKISKIVLNRTNVTSSDPRRASASAYVTFVHKEDTLSCILALDGFFLDGRNIRASYGTSKYCSAFIKNVRCNNPDCTYLHCMGEAEDTFTKQEIQAGYVTSGRDVLARQQQIVAEALSAAGGGSGAGTRRKVGGGGPSGTGKASANPVFPPPCYDEPLKQSTATLAPQPSAPANRSMSVGSAVPSGAATPVTSAKISRSVSVSSGSVSPAPTATRKGSLPPALGTGASGSSNLPGIGGATAASVVAGVHSLGNTTPPAEASAAHTTLTPLTPLKRTGRGKSSNSLPQDASDTAAQVPHTGTKQSKLSSLRNGSSHKSSSLKNGLYGTAPTSPSSSVSSASAAGKLAASQHNNNEYSVGSIGGQALGPSGISGVDGNLIGSSTALGISIGGYSGGGGNVEGSAALGGHPIVRNTDLGGTSSSLGGEVFTGELPSRSDSAIGQSKDKWNSAAPGDRGSGLFGSSGSLSIGGGDIWGNESVGTSVSVGRHSSRSPGVIGGSNSSNLGSIGPANAGFASSGGYNSNSGSSALASMLGINLPTGSGSLQEASNLWNGNPPSQAPVSSPHGRSAPGVIGAASRAPGGGVSLGGSSVIASGGVRASGSTPIKDGGHSSDIALLQSLLPGVHITSGNAKQPAAPGSSAAGGGGGEWNPVAGAPIGQAMNSNGGSFALGMSSQGDSWGGAPIGSSRRGNGQGVRQQEQKQSGIW